jgi:hypothetical protein
MDHTYTLKCSQALLLFLFQRQKNYLHLCLFVFLRPHPTIHPTGQCRQLKVPQVPTAAVAAAAAAAAAAAGFVPLVLLLLLIGLYPEPCSYLHTNTHITVTHMLQPQ